MELEEAITTINGVQVVDTEGAAKIVRVRPSTLRSYMARGKVPDPDIEIRRKGAVRTKKYWRPETIIEWAGKRPTQGWRKNKT